MKNKAIKIYALLITVLILFTGARIYLGATNFDRLVLGEANFGEDPNITADITGANDEYISNNTNGTWDFGAANLTTTGTVTGASFTGTFLGGGWEQFTIITNSANNQNKYDTTTIAGVDTSYRFIVTPFKAGLPVAADLLAYNVISGKLIVERADTTTANLKYSYMRIK